MEEGGRLRVVGSGSTGWPGGGEHWAGAGGFRDRGGWWLRVRSPALPPGLLGPIPGCVPLAACLVYAFVEMFTQMNTAG